MGGKVCPQCKHRFAAKYFCTKCGRFFDAHDVPYSWKQLERKARVILSRVNFEPTEIISKEDAVVELIIAAKRMDDKEYKHYKKMMQYTRMRSAALDIMEQNQFMKGVVAEYQWRLECHRDSAHNQEKAYEKVFNTLDKLSKSEQDILRQSFDLDHQGESLFRRCKGNIGKYTTMRKKKEKALEAFKEKLNET